MRIGSRNTSSTWRLHVVIVALAAYSAASLALELGQSPGASKLETLDGLPRTLDNYADRKGSVIVFLSARSSVVSEQITAMNTLAEEVRFKGVLFIGVCSDPDQGGEELREFLQRKGAIIPVYRDPSRQVAKQFGAAVTPEYFLLDKDGKLLYHGALGTKEKGLAVALANLIEGKSVKVEPVALDGDPIDAKRAKLDISDPYGTMYFRSEMIFEKIPGVAVVHCSTVAEAPNGDILCLWYGGSYESAEDQSLFLARQKKGESSWSVVERIIGPSDMPPGNAVLFQNPQKRMQILWGRMESKRPIRRGSGWGECRLMQRFSDDNGATWSADTEIPDSMGSLPRNLPLTLKDGTFALPVSGESAGNRGSYLMLLQPDGVTWTRSGVATGGSQPTVIQRDNGDLLSLMRRQPRIMESVSTDGGKTWSNSKPTDLKNPGSGICMTRLKSGRIVLAFNDTDQDDRTPFNVIQSYDGGETWMDIRILEADWGEFSYPSIMQSSEGRIHLTYTYRRFTIKHSVFDEGWLTRLERPN
jgi:predicted neuraminidase/peroxiredoxin